MALARRNSICSFHQPFPQRFHGRWRDEDKDGVVDPAFKLSGALHIDVEYGDFSGGFNPVNLFFGGSVIVPVHLGPLNKFTPAHHFMELINLHEIIAPGGLLVPPRRSSGRGNRKLEAIVPR